MARTKYLIFTPDSKRHRRGLPTELGPFLTIKAALSKVRCARPFRPIATRTERQNQCQRAWEVTCDDTVVADVFDRCPRDFVDELLLNRKPFRPKGPRRR